MLDVTSSSKNVSSNQPNNKGGNKAMASITTFANSIARTVFINYDYRNSEWVCDFTAAAYRVDSSFTWEGRQGSGSSPSAALSDFTNVIDGDQVGFNLSNSSQIEIYDVPSPLTPT